MTISIFIMANQEKKICIFFKGGAGKTRFFSVHKKQEKQDHELVIGPWSLWIMAIFTLAMNISEKKI